MQFLEFFIQNFRRCGNAGSSFSAKTHHDKILLAVKQIIYHYYWILYYSYLSPQRYENANEILYALDGKGFTLSIRTYYSRREEALSILSSVLWGYTSVKCNDILDLFMVD